MKYKLTNIYFTDADKYFYELTNDHLDYLLMKNKLNRSEIGKKAYKTFLKNGGKRDSKGRFSKENLSWKYEDLINFITTKKIDWETLETEARCEHRINCVSNKKVSMSRVFAKVFKKHGLIREGVEI